MGRIRDLLSDLISKYKGTPFSCDAEVPDSYLLFLFWENLLKYLNGVRIFKRPHKKVLVGWGSQIVETGKIELRGNNLHIDRNCFINALSKRGISFGQNVSIHKNVQIECSGSITSIGDGLFIGDNVGIGSFSFLGCAGGVKIGSDTIMANYVSLHSEGHNCQGDDIPIRLQGVTRKGIEIGSNCWIGAKATILDGSKLGNGSIVAAGAVVTGQEFPPNSVVGGVPARLIKSRV